MPRTSSFPSISNHIALDVMMKTMCQSRRPSVEDGYGRRAQHLRHPNLIRISIWPVPASVCMSGKIHRAQHPTVRVTLNRNQMEAPRLTSAIVFLVSSPPAVAIEALSIDLAPPTMQVPATSRRLGATMEAEQANRDSADSLQMP
jgi:hypothetical protein